MARLAGDSRAMAVIARDGVGASGSRDAVGSSGGGVSSLGGGNGGSGGGCWHDVHVTGIERAVADAGGHGGHGGHGRHGGHRGHGGPGGVVEGRGPAGRGVTPVIPVGHGGEPGSRAVAVAVTLTSMAVVWKRGGRETICWRRAGEQAVGGLVQEPFFFFFSPGRRGVGIVVPT